jgi:hypothetical protein
LLDRAANGQYLAQRLIQVCVRRICHRPVASNTELKKQRAAAAGTTSRMSTSESPRPRSGFSSASLMSAGEARDLAGQLADGCMQRIYRLVTRGFGSSAGLWALFRWPRVRSGGGFALSGGLCVAICPGPGLASRSPSTSTHLDDRGMHGEGSPNRRQAKAPTSAVRHNNKINYWRLMTRSFLAVLMILL